MRMLLAELNRIHSHLVWLGTSGARARGDLDVLVLLPRARPDPRPLRDGDRVPHAHALFPGRRARRGHPGRLLPRVPQVRRLDAAGARRLPRAARPQPDLARADEGDRAPVRGGRGRDGPVGPGAARVGRRLGQPQALSRTSPTTRSSSTSRSIPRATCTRATGCTWTRCAQSVRIVEQCLDRLEELRDGPWIADDRKVVLPPRHELHTSMESLIHHFKIVTEGYRVPGGRGLHRDRVAARRERLLRRLGRRPEAVAREVPRPVVRRARRWPR